MINYAKVAVVMSAYNSEQMLRKTYREVMDQDIVNLVILVDDAGQDKTTAILFCLAKMRRMASSG